MLSSPLIQGQSVSVRFIFFQKITFKHLQKTCPPCRNAEAEVAVALITGGRITCQAFVKCSLTKLNTPRINHSVLCTMFSLKRHIKIFIMAAQNSAAAFRHCTASTVINGCFASVYEHFRATLGGLEIPRASAACHLLSLEIPPCAQRPISCSNDAPVTNSANRYLQISTENYSAETQQTTAACGRSVAFVVLGKKGGNESLLFALVLLSCPVLFCVSSGLTL